MDEKTVRRMQRNISSGGENLKRLSATDLQVQQQTLRNQSEFGPVSGEEHQPLLLKEARKHLEQKPQG